MPLAPIAISPPFSLFIGWLFISESDFTVTGVNDAYDTGAGESGKSTIFKQMRILYGTSFSDQDRANHVGFVCSNTIASMKALIEAAEGFGFEINAEDAAEAIKDLSEETKIDHETAEQIKTLWSDPGIQNAYSRRNEFQLYDSAPQYVETLRHSCCCISLLTSV